MSISWLHTFGQTCTGDEVQAERDLAEIPAVLHALTATWQDPKSFNCQSAW